MPIRANRSAHVDPPGGGSRGLVGPFPANMSHRGMTHAPGSGFLTADEAAEARAAMGIRTAEDDERDSTLLTSAEVNEIRTNTWGPTFGRDARAKAQESPPFTIARRYRGNRQANYEGDDRDRFD